MTSGPENPSNMKLHPEDPRLTAYVLGELGPEDAAAVERAVAADPALQAEVAGIQGARQFLTERLAVSGEKLLPSQRENIRRNARLTSRPAGFPSFASLQAWLIPAAAAAVLALATFILMRMPGEPRANTATAKPGKAITAASVPPVKTAPEIARSKSGLPVIPQREAISPADFPTLDLPVSPEKSGLEVVSKSILTDAKLPGRDVVRLEEILNNFPLRLNGTASIARSAANNWHPDNRESGMSTHVATLSTELVACPWKPSAVLLLVSVRASPQKDSDLKISYHPVAASVFRYRLLGCAPDDTAASIKLPSKVPAGALVNLAIEIEPSVPGGSLGSLVWSADGTNAPPITLTHNKDAEPSDDARFGALVCTFSQWLAGEQLGLIDAEVVAALARETMTAALPPERATFLDLIDKSLLLPGAESVKPAQGR